MYTSSDRTANDSKLMLELSRRHLLHEVLGFRACQLQPNATNSIIHARLRTLIEFFVGS
jgi:hypothetical protein